MKLKQTLMRGQNVTFLFERPTNSSYDLKKIVYVLEKFHDFLKSLVDNSAFYQSNL